MNKRGEFSIQLFLISIFFVGLASGFVLITVKHMSQNSDNENFQEDILNDFRNDEIYENLEQANNESNDVNVLDPFIPDILGTFIQKSVKAIKTILQSMDFMNALINNFFKYLGMDSNMASLMVKFFYAVILILVVIGFLIIRIYMGKNDGGT